MNNYFMSGKLIHKASDHNARRCEVEKWVFYLTLILSGSKQTYSKEKSLIGFRFLKRHFH